LRSWQEFAYGTFETCRDVRSSVAIGGKEWVYLNNDASCCDVTSLNVAHNFSRWRTRRATSLAVDAAEFLLALSGLESRNVLQTGHCQEWRSVASAVQLIRALRYASEFGSGFKCDSHFFGTLEGSTDVSIFRTGIECN